MNLRDRIREKMSPRSSTNQYDPATQPNLYKLEDFLRKSGYRLTTVEEGPEIIIDAVKDDYLHPEISHDVSTGSFYAKIAEHGLLVASDLEEIIKGYDTALHVLEYLNKVDLDSLEIDDGE